MENCIVNELMKNILFEMNKTIPMSTRLSEKIYGYVNLV
jgi:hypothetical protein